MHFLPGKDIVIVGAARTPIGGFDGILKGRSAPELGAIAIRAALERSGVPAGEVDEVIMGNVVSAGIGQVPAKQAAVAAGIPHTSRATLVNTVCSSSLTAVWAGVQSLLVGSSKVVVAGGMESRSSAPYLLGPRSPEGRRVPGQLTGFEYHLRTPDGGDTLDDYRALLDLLHKAGVRDANQVDGLVCAFNRGKSMTDYAIAFARRSGFSIESIDRAACESYRRADEAWASHEFADEVVPVGEAKTDQLVPRRRWENLCGMSDSECSAYNTPPLGDGGAAVVLTTRERAKELGVSPVARILGMSRHDCPPEEFVESPVHAVAELTDALRAAGRPADFPIMEANESFGMQLILFNRTWPGRVINVHGGAVALKHPMGAAGARILTTLLYAMKRCGHPRGIAVICFGGGGAVAIAVEAEV
jgi:acetyl-CoA C-acetyltransferase